MKKIWKAHNGVYLPKHYIDELSKPFDEKKFKQEYQCEFVELQEKEMGNGEQKAPKMRKLAKEYNYVWE